MTFPAQFPAPPAASGVTVHVGCGYAQEWRGADGGLAAPPGAGLVLVEPNPACAAELRDLARGRDGIVVIEAAICGPAPAGEPARDRLPFHILTVEDLSGLHGTPPLAHLMPGLRVEDRVTVAAMTLPALLAELGLAGTDNRLILETLGEEGRILQDLADGAALAPFSALALQVARDPVPAGAAAGADVGVVTDLLAARGFRLQDGSETGDPDFPRLDFRRDALLEAGLQIAALHQQLARAEADGRSALAQAGEDAAREAETFALVLQDQESLRSQLESRIAALQAAVDQAEAALREAEAGQAALQAGHEALQQQAAELQAVLGTARAERDGLAGIIPAIEQDRDAALARADREAARAAAAEGRSAEQAAALAALQAALDGARTEIADLGLQLGQSGEERDVALCVLAEAQQQAGHLQTVLAETQTLRDDLAARLSVVEAERDAAQANADRECQRAGAAEAALAASRTEAQNLHGVAAAMERERNAAQANADRECRRADALQQAVEQAAAAADAQAARIAAMAEEAQAHHATRERQQGRIAQLESNVNEARTQAREAADRAAELALQLTRAGEDRAATAEALTAAEARIAAVETAVQQAGAAARLAADKAAARIAVLEGEATARQARIAALEGEHAAALARLRQTEAQLGTLTAQLAGSQRSAATLQADLAERSRSLSETAAALAEAKAEARAQEGRAARTQQDLGFALRLQALSGADLKDLQARYAEVLARKEQQDALIAQLVVRLGEASDHLRNLALAAPPEPAALPEPRPPARLSRPAPPDAADPDAAPKPASARKSGAGKKSAAKSRPKPPPDPVPAGPHGRKAKK